MPYTLLHPGLITPIYRLMPLFLHMTGLVIGSIVPDLDIIYRFSETRHHIFTYTKWNIISTILPIGLMITFYIEIFWRPISEKGKPEITINKLKKLAITFPKIVLSVLIGILVHIYIDQYAHFDDTTTLAVQIKNSLGYENHELKYLEIVLLYLPQLITSTIALIFTVYSIFIFRKEIYIQLKFLVRNIRTTLFIFFMVCICFTSMKIIKAGIENYLVFDSIAIAITCGLLSAIFLSPSLLWLYKIFVYVPANLIYLLIWVITLYNFGLPQKEYLSVFIAKELLIIAIAILLYFTFSRLLISDKKINLIKTVWLTILLGILSNIAYYISSKGLGTGVIALFIVSLILVQQKVNSNMFPKRNYIHYIDKILIVVLLFNVHPTVGIICAFLVLAIFTFKIFSDLPFKMVNFFFYIICLPIISVLFIGGNYSIMYGMFALSQFLIAWLFIFSNYFVVEDITIARVDKKNYSRTMD